MCNILTASFRWTSHREAATLKREKRRMEERERERETSGEKVSQLITKSERKN